MVSYDTKEREKRKKTKEKTRNYICNLEKKNIKKGRKDMDEGKR